MTHLVLLRPKIDYLALPNPPIGLGYLASVLKKNGHQVEIIDCANLKESYSQISSQVKQLNPDVIGLTALSSYYNEMVKLASSLHKLGIPLILGGVHASALPEQSLRDCKADFAVIGEGEITTLDLMDNWANEAKRKTIVGIAYFEDDQFKLNSQRELIQNLDEIPFPAWDLINPLKYHSEPHGAKMKRYPVAPILTTRGCPFCCSYCTSTNFWGNKFRRRSPQNVVDEIEFLVNKFGIREIHIWDDNFTLVRKHVIGICKEILQRKLDLTLACPNGVRIDYLNKEILSIMRRAGFYSLTFAIESGAQSVLQRANKKMNLKIIPKMAKIAKNLGYSLPSFFIFGLPGETYETARKTIQLMKQLPLDAILCFIAKPIPGSNYFKEWIQNKDISKIDYSWFHFIEEKNTLEFTDGKRKLNLPIDAYREFYLRPIQFLRYIKFQTRIFHLRQFRFILHRIFHLIFNLNFNYG